MEAETIYSRISVVRTPTARIPRLFQTRSGIPNKMNPIPADIIVFGIISGDFHGMLCVLIRIASMRQF